MIKGIALYIWHYGKAKYDEVVHLPSELSESEAKSVALVRLHSDERASRVQLELGGGSLFELSLGQDEWKLLTT